MNTFLRKINKWIREWIKMNKIMTKRMNENEYNNK